MRNNLKKLALNTPILLGVGFLVWGILINLLRIDGQRDLFTDLYYFIPIFGGLAQLVASYAWGGFSSYIGKSFRYFSLALFSEGLGLLIYSFYFRIKGEELAYPSAGDFVFVIGIIGLVLGCFWLLKVIAPIKKQLIFPIWHIVMSTILIGFLFLLAWKEFLSVGLSDDRGGLTVLFNVIYPTTQLIYIGFCFLALLKVRHVSGGRMFRPILLLLMSFCLLYISDFIFLRQSYNEEWQAAGLSDMLYVTSYTAIVWSLHYFDTVRAGLLSRNRGNK